MFCLDVMHLSTCKSWNIYNSKQLPSSSKQNNQFKYKYAHTNQPARWHSWFIFTLSCGHCVDIRISLAFNMSIFRYWHLVCGVSTIGIWHGWHGYLVNIISAHGNLLWFYGNSRCHFRFLACICYTTACGWIYVINY